MTIYRCPCGKQEKEVSKAKIIYKNIEASKNNDKSE